MGRRRNCINKFDLQQVADDDDDMTIMWMEEMEKSENSQTFTRFNERIKNTYTMKIQFEVNLFLLNFSFSFLPLAIKLKRKRVVKKEKIY